VLSGAETSGLLGSVVILRVHILLK
jgi:hypothetical protein